MNGNQVHPVASTLAWGPLAGCFALIMLVGCAQRPVTPAVEQGDLRLQNDQAWVDLSVSPFPRVTGFGRIGALSVVNTDPHRFAGIRTWFMEPGQVKQSGYPANMPGHFLKRERRHAVIAGATDSATGLQVVMEVTLDETRAALLVRHGVRNNTDRSRVLSAWGIVSVRRSGLIEMNADAPDLVGLHLVFFEDLRPDDPAMSYESKRVRIEPGAASRAVKIGVASSDGRITWADGPERVEVESGRHEGVYPEGGAHVTAYVSAPGGRLRWAELEHLSPLTSVPPGGTVWLEQRLSLPE